MENTFNPSLKLRIDLESDSLSSISWNVIKRLNGHFRGKSPEIKSWGRIQTRRTSILVRREIWVIEHVILPEKRKFWKINIRKQQKAEIILNYLIKHDHLAAMGARGWWYVSPKSSPKPQDHSN